MAKGCVIVCQLEICENSEPECNVFRLADDKKGPPIGKRAAVLTIMRKPLRKNL